MGFSVTSCSSFHFDSSFRHQSPLFSSSILSLLSLISRRFSTFYLSILQANFSHTIIPYLYSSIHPSPCIPPTSSSLSRLLPSSPPMAKSPSSRKSPTPPFLLFFFDKTRKLTPTQAATQAATAQPSESKAPSSPASAKTATPKKTQPSTTATQTNP